MKNILIFILLLGLLYGLSTLNKGRSPIEIISGNKTEKITLSGLEGINYSIVDIPGEVMVYLETDKYKNVPSNKKIVRYFAGTGCPYGDTFAKAIQPLANSLEYTSKYYFNREKVISYKKFKDRKSAQIAMDFERLCKEFCIINPEKSQIFRISGVGFEEAVKLPVIVEQLKNW